MLQNPRITAFTVSELLTENQQGRVKSPPFTPIPHPTQIRVNTWTKQFFQTLYSPSK